MNSSDLVIWFFCGLGLVATILFYRNLRKQNRPLWQNIVGMTVYLAMIVWILRAVINYVEQVLA